MQQSNNFLFSLILSVIILSQIALAQTVDQQVSLVRKNVATIDQTINWIYSTTYSRRPSGNPGWFHGDRAYFIYYVTAPLNGADVSFGYFLYYTYNMYCSLRRLASNCLGAKLKVDFSISGRDFYSAKVFYIRTAAGTISSNYFQQVRADFFSHLEAIGGSVVQTAAIRAELYKARTFASPLNLYISTNDAGAGNDSWRQSDYLYSLLEKIKSIVGNVAGFKLTLQQQIRSSFYYDNHDQYPLLANYNYLRGFGRVTAIVSGFNTPLTAGLSWLGRTDQPIFVMRSRYNYPYFNTGNTINYKSETALDNTAKIFLHELGHNMGLNHCNAVATGALCTDNYWLTDSGRQFLLSYLNSLGAMHVVYSY